MTEIWMQWKSPGSLIATCGCEGQGQERFLLHLMGLGGSGGRASAGGTLDRAKVEPPGFRYAFESRQNKAGRAHVAGLFLNPNDFSRIGMLRDGCVDFRARQRVELVEEENRRAGVLTAAAFGTKFMSNFAAGDQDALGVLHFAVRNERQKTRASEFFDSGTGVGMAQHALRRKNDQRLAPRAAHLPAQHVKILRSGRRLANLHVIFGGELQEALEARAGMLRPLALVAVRQKHDEAGRQVPLVFTGADELVDDDLGAVGEIAELRFP